MRTGPAVGVVAAQDAAHHLEGRLKVHRLIEHGERAGAQCARELARILAACAPTLDDDRGRGLLEACEEFEDPASALFAGGARDAAIVAREREIDAAACDRVPPLSPI